MSFIKKKYTNHLLKQKGLFVWPKYLRVPNGFCYIKHEWFVYVCVCMSTPKNDAAECLFSFFSLMARQP